VAAPHEVPQPAGPLKRGLSAATTSAGLPAPKHAATGHAADGDMKPEDAVRLAADADGTVGQTATLMQ